MSRCPHCQRLLDDASRQQARCGGCGAVLHPVPRRTVAGLSVSSAAAAGDSSSGDSSSGDSASGDPSSGASAASDTAVGERLAETLQTLHFEGTAADLPAVGAAASGGDAPPGAGGEADRWPTLGRLAAEPPAAGPGTPGTVLVQGDQTLDLPLALGAVGLAGAEGGAPVDLTMLTSQWQSTVHEQGPAGNVNATIRQQETVVGPRTSGSSLVVKSRQIRSRDDVPKFITSVEDAPDYELLEVIGEGGMGVVYAARQSSIARTVAVKMLKGQRVGGAEQRDKFISEAVVTGELDHPNIVPIYDLGTNSDGALFYSMKRVKGTPWNKVIRQLPLDENLTILLRVADAVAFAHVNGVVHRDLKPENIMLGDYGEVLVMDWGLARICPDFPNAESITQTASMGGTPAYMAPEMASGPVERVTAASDIYLLGAILHEIVAGVPPHRGDSVMACLFAAAKNQIVATESSGELYEIALRAMATDPAARYASVKHLQEAIRAYQAHSESILLTDHAAEHLAEADQHEDYSRFARAAYGFEEALGLWPENRRAADLLAKARLAYARRALRQGDFDLGLSLLHADDPEHRQLAAELEQARGVRQSRQRAVRRLKAAVAALAAAVLAIVAYAYWAVSFERDEARSQRDRAVAAEADAQENFRTAVTQRERAERNEQQAQANRQLAEQRREEAEANRQRAEQQRQLAVAAQEAEQYSAYVARIGLTRAKIDENAFDSAAELLGQCPPSLRHWEWGRLQQLCHLSTRSWDLGAPVAGVAFRGDGRHFATADWNGQVSVWDARTGERLWQRPCGQYVHAVAYDPAGRRLAAAGSDQVVRLFDADSGDEVQTLRGHEDAVLCLDFSPDGSLLASGGYDNVVRLWDAASAMPLAVLRRHSWWVRDVAFAPDGQRLATAGQDGKVLVWGRAAGEQGSEWTAGAEFLEHRGPVHAAAFDPSGARIVSGGEDGRVLRWNPDDAPPLDLGRLLDGQPPAPPPFETFVGHRGPVQTVAFAADGTAFATGGHDNLVLVWSPAASAPRLRLRGHASHVSSVAFSPDGAALVSAGRDRRVHWWRLDQYAETYAVQSPEGADGAVLAARFSADGRLIATAGSDRQARLWNARDRRLLRDFAEGHAFLASSAVYFADGTRLATAAGDGTVRLWNADSGAEIDRLERTGLSAAVDVSADGRWLAAAGDDRQVRLYDMAARRAAPALEGHEAAVTAVRFSPAGRVLAAGDERGVGRLWLWDEAASGWRAGPVLRGHSRAITALAFVADGTRLLTASGDNTCGQWDVATGREIAAGVLKHPDWVADLAVARDGRQALTCCDDGRLRLWDLEQARVVRTLQPAGPPRALTSVALSPDGAYAAAVCAADATVHLWKLADGSPVPAPVPSASASAWLDGARQRTLVWAVRFGPDSRSLLAVGGSEARLLDLATQRQRVRYSPHGAVAAVDLSPDGSRLATGSWDRSAKIWDAATGKALFKLDGEHRGAVNSVQFAPDGARVLTGSDDGSARLWDARDGAPLEPVLQGPAGRVRQAAFTPDGKGALTVSDDKQARLWDLATGRVVRAFRGHAWGLLAGACSPDGTRILTGGEDNVALLWDVAAEAPLFRLAGHTAAVTSVAFSRDGRRVLTGSDDALVKLWDARTGKELLTLAGHDEGVTSVGFSPDDRWVLTTGRDGRILLWPAASWSDGEASSREPSG
jgi:WD40 repeat protein